MRYALIALALTAAACSPSTSSTELPALNGHRVQGTSIVAQSSVPRRVSAYELVFGGRRAALVVELAGGQGLVRGFVEWGGPGAPSLTYLVEGWARQHDVEGQPVTVFDLALIRLNTPADKRQASASADVVAPATVPPPAVRVVLNETSGAATLRSRR